MAGEKASLDVSMLLAFRAENVRSFRDGLELSLLATALAEKGVPHQCRGARAAGLSRYSRQRASLARTLRGRATCSGL